MFTLLDYMKKKGALDKGDSFSIRWGREAYTASVGPEDWLDKTNPWEVRRDAVQYKVSFYGKTEGDKWAEIGRAHV